MKEKSKIINIFLISLAIIPLYIYAYDKSAVLLFTIFILDRIFSVLFRFDVEKTLDKMNISEDNIECKYEEIYDDEIEPEGSIVIKDETVKFFIKIIMLCVVGIIMGIYTLFNYPKLLILSIIGAIIDRITFKIRSAIKLRNSN